MGKTERQHYVPESHLREYSDAGGVLYMLDRRTGKTVQANARTVARQHDYYKLEGETPRAAEDLLGEVEREAAAAVRAVMTPRPRAPTADEAASIIIRAAIQTTRGPAFRDRIEAFHREVAQDAQMLARAHGVERALDRDPSRNELIGHAFVGASEVLEMFRPRWWTLFVVSGSTDLITSDNPVVCFPKSGEYPPIGSFGWGLANTVVLVPLSRRALLMGDWDAAAPRPIEISRRQAAAFNGAVAQGSHRYIFSSAPRFRFISGSVETSDVELWKRQVDE